MYLRLPIALLILIPLTSCTPLQKVTLGAFNIKVFGASKARKSDVMENIKTVMLDYDVMLVQEVRDKSQGSIEKLYKMLNSAPGVSFSYIKSVRLGRTRSKEQYVFYYRKDKLDIIGSYQYSDPDDLFEREPFTVLVRVPLANNDSMTLAIVGLHAKASKAVEEIDRLDEVCSEVKDKLLTKNLVITGDLNAGCSYAKPKDLNRTVLFSDTRNFQSLIDNNADTTTYDTSCAYDRIFVSGRELKSKKLQAEVDKIDRHLNLTNIQTQAVSDHYPVKLTITF